MKQAMQSARDYRVELKSKRERAIEVLAGIRFKKHNPIVTAELEKLSKIINSIKV